MKSEKRKKIRYRETKIKKILARKEEEIKKYFMAIQKIE